MISVALAVVLAATPLEAARKGFKTALTRETTQEPGPLQDSVLVRAEYTGPKGKLHAFTSKPAAGAGAKKKPALVWIAGGFPGGGADGAAVAFFDAGVFMVFPTLRGTDGNPGVQEGFLGEVDDVLAAIAWAKKQPGVDAKSVYLGGHSTGATLALLVAESGADVRGVIAFGPAAEACAYGDQLPFDAKNEKECEVRSPVKYLDSVRAPLWVVEGETGRTEDVLTLKGASKNPKHTFITLSRASHFDFVEPVGKVMAKRMLAGDVQLSAEEAQKAYDERPGIAVKGESWQLLLPPGFKAVKENVFSRGKQVVMVQQLQAAVGHECGEAEAAKKGITVFREKWGPHELCGLRMPPVTRDGVELVAMAVQVPLAPKGIALHVAGPLVDETQLRELVRSVLSTISAETTWK